MRILAAAWRALIYLLGNRLSSQHDPVPADRSASKGQTGTAVLPSGVVPGQIPAKVPVRVTPEVAGAVPAGPGAAGGVEEPDPAVARPGVAAPGAALSAPLPPSASLSLVGVRRRFLDGPGVTYHGSPNQGGRVVRPSPDLILLHYTAGRTMAGAVSALCDPTPKVRSSAHVVIGRDGQLVQLVPLDTVAWHAGTSTWQGHPWVNARAVGVEMVNWGVLRGAPGAWRSWTGTAVRDDQVTVVGGRGWQTYTEAQTAMCIALCQLLRSAFPIRWIIGHEQVAPGRKRDPGPAFPWARLRAEVGLQEAE